MNIGIIGLGFMGATHAGAYAKLPGVRIAAVSARDARRLRGDFSGVGGNLGLHLDNVDFSRTAKYDNWEQLVADAAVDAVDITLPSDLHAEVAIAALSAGKHVLCEKPMALTALDCDRMLAKANESKRVLMIGHVLRFAPAYRYLQEFAPDVTAATLTRVCRVPDWSSWLPNALRSGGALLDLLIHDIDQILLLFGSPYALRAKRLGEFDAVSATFLYPEGPEVRLRGGWMAPGTPFSMGFQVRTHGALIELRQDGLLRGDSGGREMRIELPDADLFKEELGYFQQCCDAGQELGCCPPEASAAAVKLALLLRESVASDGEEIRCEL